MRFGLVEAEKANYPVALMCRVVEVSRAGFYAWCKRPASTRALEDQRLRLEVSAIHAASRRSYGSPRVHMELRERGRRVGRKRVARLMRTAGLRGRMLRRFRRTSDSGHAMAIRDSLLARRFAVARANFGWVADITLFVDAGGLAVLGGDPRPVLAAGSGGGSMSERLENKLALDALSTALAERQPRGGLIHHSDRGSQYATHEYQELLASCGLPSSISRKGNCWDNAVAESFFATLKIELAYQLRWSTRAQARNDVFEYVEVFDNRRRRHSALGFRCPDEFERAQQRKLAA